MNWMLFPTLALSLIFFAAGVLLWERTKTCKLKALLLLAAAAFSIPALLYDFFYLHLFDNAAWFYQLRALPLSELLAAGAGLSGGVAAAFASRWKLISRPFIISMLLIGLTIPYLKPLLAPLPKHKFRNIWDNGVCLQSTSSSCGSASAATLLSRYGTKVQEAEIAERCFTCQSGTENWYLARFLRERGQSVDFITRLPREQAIPVPSIAGVAFGGVGHFIAILEETKDAYITGDPLIGLRIHAKTEIREKYQFTGFFLKLQNRSNN